MNRIPVILCIDVEPDERVIDPADRAAWRGFEISTKYFERLRDRLERATGAPAHYAWFFRTDPQVARVYGSAAWALRNYTHEVQAIESAGDEIGVHTHPWRWDEGRRTWSTDFGDPVWVEDCVRLSFEAFREAMGRGSDSFRFGDRWMNDATMALVASLGVSFDLTLEPGHSSELPAVRGELGSGSIPSYRGVPRLPYRPSRRDFRKADPSRQDGLWVIPLSTGQVVRWTTPLRWGYAMLRGLKRRPEWVTLGLWHPADLFCGVMDRLLRSGVPYLAMAVRSDLPLRPQTINMDAIFEYILAHPWIDRFVFCTPREAMALLGTTGGRSYTTTA